MAPGFEVNAAEVDRTLIEEMRKLSPQERLRWNDRAVAQAEELRKAFQRSHPHAHE